MDACHALIRVRVPDRPGALGLVASRIGALKSDIIGISVLDRSDGSAIDELAVVIPDADLIPAMVREIAEVDGATVESVEIVDGIAEPRFDVLERAIALSRSGSRAELATELTRHVQELLRPEWCVTTGPQIHAALGTIGTAANATLSLPVLGWTVSIGRASALTATEHGLATRYCELADEVGQRLSALTRTD
ncbi:MAG: hypothetical protein JJE46_01625 [Acidimicrobiia bacterium]|nr:hypothetical protein [Acidimicrobiia bacterium]